MNQALAPTRTTLDLGNARGIGRGAIVALGSALPPAARAAAASPRVSSRYAFISTQRVVDLMADEGFVVHSSAARRPRVAGTAAFGVHALDFRHPDLPEVMGVVPRIVFLNSHDGGMAARAYAGAFRMVCSNGMVSGSIDEYVAQRHAGDVAEDLVRRMRDLSRSSSSLFQQIERWSRVQLAPAQRVELARRAAELRWGDQGRVTAGDLLEVTRPEDAAGDLWTVFNRVQEATTQRSLPAVAASGRLTMTRPLLSPQANVQFNADLWKLAEEMA